MRLFGSPDIEELRRKRDWQTLSHLRKHHNPTIRQQAWHAWEYLSAPAEIRMCIDQTEDADPRQRMEAIQRLGKEVLFTLASQPFLERCLDDPQPEVRRAAAEAIGALDLLASKQTLIDHAGDHDEQVREGVIDALGRLAYEYGGDDELFRLFMRALDDLLSVRRAAVFALGAFPEEAAMETIELLCRDEDEKTRIQAARALGQIGAKHPLAQASDSLLNLLEDSSAAVRLEALQAVDNAGSMLEKANLRRMIDIIQKIQQKDRSVRVRHFAWGVLIQLQAQDQEK